MAPRCWRVEDHHAVHPRRWCLEDFDAVHSRLRHLEVTTRMTITHTVLSTLAGLVAGGSVAIIAQAGMPSAEVVSIPWDKILGVGSGGLAFWVAYYFLQREERMRKAHDEATQAITKTFADTTHTMVREVREEAEKREQRMILLFQQRTA